MIDLFSFLFSAVLQFTSIIYIFIGICALLVVATVFKFLIKGKY